MPITTDQLIKAIEAKNGFPLDTKQIDAITHGTGPLWLIAGPGTGKTEVLVVRCLKLVCCDGVDPGSIMVTTFTEKAARSLEDRIADAMAYVVGVYPFLGDIDVTRLRVGTLHSLSNEILQEFRYRPYQNLRLLDEIEGQMLVRARLASSVRAQYPSILRQFPYLFENPTQPNLWHWTKAIRTLLDRLIEDRVDLAAMQSAGGVWADVAAVNTLYEQELSQRYMCDFARLQRFFLEFLGTGQGQLFLQGDGTLQRPPLRYVLVDEYQDTNPIQEEIYFALAGNAPYNLTVVGDDDQALYRFRGGTVECMVDFGDQCRRKWGVAPTRVELVMNYRSDKRIVDWCTDFITSFPQMVQARVPNKPALNSALGVRGTYPAVGYIRETRVADLASTFAITVEGLLQNGIIEDYSQCVLLLRSTRDSIRNAGPYVSALRGRGIPVYNPRSKAFVDQQEIQQVLGALVTILDPYLAVGSNVMIPGVVQMLSDWRQAYQQIAGAHPQLSTYVQGAQQAILQAAPGERLTSAAPTIYYRILAHTPFTLYQADPLADLRLSKLSRLLEAFCAQHDRALYTDDQKPGQVNNRWLSAFYYNLCGYMEAAGLDDDEDDEVIAPPGMFPIMTIHQAKGLEFDFVFVGTLGHGVNPGSAHNLEEDLRPYRMTPPNITYPKADAAWQDEARLHFVAYSRAKTALILLTTAQQLGRSDTASFSGRGGPWARQNLLRL